MTLPETTTQRRAQQDFTQQEASTLKISDSTHHLHTLLTMTCHSTPPHPPSTLPSLNPSPSSQYPPPSTHPTPEKSWVKESPRVARVYAARHHQGGLIALHGHRQPACTGRRGYGAARAVFSSRARRARETDQAI